MDRTWVSSIAYRCFTVWATSKPQWMAYFHLAAESIPKWCTGWTWTSFCVLVAQCIHCCMVVFGLSVWLLSTAGAPWKKGPPDNNTHFCTAEKTQIECSLSMFGRDVWYSLIMYADCFRMEHSGWMFTVSGRWMLPVVSSTGTLKLSGLCTPLSVWEILIPKAVLPNLFHIMNHSEHNNVCCRTLQCKWMEDFLLQKQLLGSLASSDFTGSPFLGQTYQHLWTANCRVALLVWKLCPALRRGRVFSTSQ